MSIKQQSCVEAMKQALEALENWLEFDPENFGATDNRAVTALRQAIAEAEKQTSVSEVEPVAKVCHEFEQHIGWNPNAKVNEFPEGMPLYTHPQPKREPLTDELVDYLHGEANRGFCIEREDYFKAFRDAEAAHGIKEKNT